MKNGNFKCERKIMRCGSNLFKKLMYRMRDISDFDKLANYQHICENCLEIHTVKYTVDVIDYMNTL